MKRLLALTMIFGSFSSFSEVITKPVAVVESLYKDSIDIDSCKLKTYENIGEALCQFSYVPKQPENVIKSERLSFKSTADSLLKSCTVKSYMSGTHFGFLMKTTNSSGKWMPAEAQNCLTELIERKGSLIPLEVRILEYKKN